MSFGTTIESKVLKKAIEDAKKAGILLVSSAGNGNEAGIEYPAAFEEVIAVGAVDTSANKTEESAVGKELEIVAPGAQSYTHMKSQVTSSYILEKGTKKSWETIFAERGLNYAGLGGDYIQKTHWRRLFLYGMASHIATDAFAHSAYCRCGTGGTFIKVTKVHTYDDEPSIHPDRFSDAKATMFMTLYWCCKQKMGTELDFAPQKWGEKRGYCLLHILKYANDSAVKYTDSVLKSAYMAINYEP